MAQVMNSWPEGQFGMKNTEGNRYLLDDSDLSLGSGTNHQVLMSPP